MLLSHELGPKRATRKDYTYLSEKNLGTCRRLGTGNRAIWTRPRSSVFLSEWSQNAHGSLGAYEISRPETEVASPHYDPSSLPCGGDGHCRAGARAGGSLLSWPGGRVLSGQMSAWWSLSSVTSHGDPGGVSPGRRGSG